MLQLVVHRVVPVLGEEKWALSAHSQCQSPPPWNISWVPEHAPDRQESHISA